MMGGSSTTGREPSRHVGSQGQDVTGQETAQDRSEKDSGSPATDLVVGPGIDSAVEKRVKKHAAVFKTYYRRTVEEAWELGRALREAKGQVRHGQWIPWLRVEIGLSPRTAQRLLALHERYPNKTRLVSYFDSVSQALRTLALAPQSDKKDGRGRADSGRTSTGEAEQRTTETVGGSLPAIVKQLELVLERPQLAAAVQQESNVQDLQSLLELTILAGTAVKTRLSAGDERSPALTEEAVANVVDVLEGIRGLQDAQLS